MRPSRVATSRNADAVRETDGRQSVLGSPLDARYTFQSFVEGPSNRVAFAAAKAVAESQSNAVRFNPLFLHATVGLGKTHLLQAIAAESIKQNPQSRVVYLTAEYFMWRFATAIRDNNALTLKEQLRDIDLLIIDDMQFLQGKSIQHEFCHLINMLLDSAKQVVVAADRPPAELESLEPRVRSRLNGGVALEMSTPDFGMRLAMLKFRLASAKAEDHSLDIPEEILSHVARTVTGSGRELEGAFNQLLFRHSFEPQITIDRIDEILGHIYRSGEPKRVRIEDIQKIVARHYNVSKTELLSNRRTQDDREAATGRHVPVEGDDAAFPARNRAPLRRSRPHDRVARRAQDRGPFGLGQHACAGTGIAAAADLRSGGLTCCDWGCGEPAAWRARRYPQKGPRKRSSVPRACLYPHFPVSLLRF